MTFWSNKKWDCKRLSRVPGQTLLHTFRYLFKVPDPILLTFYHLETERLGGNYSFFFFFFFLQLGQPWNPVLADEMLGKFGECGDLNRDLSCSWLQELGMKNELSCLLPPMPALEYGHWELLQPSDSHMERIVTITETSTQRHGLVSHQMKTSKQQQQDFLLCEKNNLLLFEQWPVRQWGRTHSKGIPNYLRCLWTEGEQKD